MNAFLPFIISGIATGSVYGLAGTGLVLTYKTSGIFNFGYGALATAAAYLFYWLHLDLGLGVWPALVVSVVVAGPVLGLGMERIARGLASRGTAMKIVGTVGLILVVQGLATVWRGADTVRVRHFLPMASRSFRVGGVNVQYPQLWVTLVAIIAVALLFAVFRWSRTGLAMRAVVDDPDLLSMQATSPVRVRRISWAVGTTFAALSGVLVLPFIGLNAISLTFLVVQAFGAAAIGGFANIPLTFVGGLLLGVGSDLSKKYILDVSWLSGLPASLPFIVLFVVLLVTPKNRLAGSPAAEARPRLRYHAPAPVRAGTAAVVVAVLALVPLVVGADKLGFYTIGLTQMVIVLALGLLVRTSGQVSLCQSVFAAIGAVAFSQFAVGHGIPWLVAVLLGALVAVPVGAIVAIPAIRLSGLFLALATFGFGILVERLLYARGFMFTVLQNGRSMPRPSLATGDRAYYYVVLAFVVVTALAMVALHASRLGRMLRGLAEAPIAVMTMGLSTNTTRVIVFCISAFFAAIGGILYGGSVHFAVSGDTNYTAFYSLVLVAVLALAPFGEPWYAIFIGITSAIPAYVTGADTTSWLNVIFGFFAVQIAVQGGHPAMPERLRALLDRFGRPAPALAGPAPAAAAATVREPVAPARDQDAAPRTGLEVTGLGVRFGGLVAVDGLSFSAPLGRITGLIGPNGAGKTTTFDACSGLNRRASGRISLHGQDITGVGPAARGRAGLGRTFQRMQLGDSLTVADNVALGREASLAGGHVWAQVAATPRQRRESRDAALAALDLCGIADLADQQAGALSTGQRRLVELARGLAGPFDVLLLDEPSSGLDHAETAAFDEVLRRVVAERGCGILLVEHDMSLVLTICEYVYVLDFGRLLFEGEPAAVAASPLVQAAYLGSDAVAQGAPALSAVAERENA
ncbi:MULTISPECIES: branched-chain amino acid ABC transporter permease/ATP-binding protein [Pseudofrankia]|uniref:branched-chain amino acid ABC transporter permease/ATP-binding protein n=1 Tax=Pseudofrankia TaxID=2994363 RepID=UPI000234B644|nr:MULTISPECIES: branched-chain amino acid ABC transporter permease/ATP-binding protein [Pseudofrankia]OHV29800.1 branched-chain amino acid ABC transporter permease/ATP-binding protein [Pseudofrankia sp. EUN1h]